MQLFITAQNIYVLFYTTSLKKLSLFLKFVPSQMGSHKTEGVVYLQPCPCKFCLQIRSSFNKKRKSERKRNRDTHKPTVIISKRMSAFAIGVAVNVT